MRYYYLVAWVLCLVSCDNGYDSHFENFDLLVRAGELRPELNQTFFPSVENYQVNAIPELMSDYPWVGRLVHSYDMDYPTMCMVSCISERIFITAARCIYSLKVEYTTILYREQRLRSIAFVMSSQPTKQLFDDIGFIVVKNNYNGTWHTIEPTDAVRTDDAFQWFADLTHPETTADYLAVCLATDKGKHNIRVAYREYSLYSMPVVVGIHMCSKIFCFNSLIDGFFVPCYHTCNLEEFHKKDTKCTKYLSSEGGAVVDMRTNQLLGIITWAAYFGKYNLPVGIAVANSKSFYEDFGCARRIREDPRPLNSPGYLQNLCDF